MLKFFLLSSILGLVVGDVTLPAYYSNGMVMQAGTSNLKIWGFTNNPDVEVLVTVECVGKTQLRSDPKNFKRSERADGTVWEVIYPVAQNNGDVCSIQIEQEASLILLEDIVFGDVWICSGQSNMEWNMNNIFNATEEIANSATYTNIRMYKANLFTSEVEEDDLLGGGWGGWYSPDDPNYLGQFSAVCFLYARSLTDRMAAQNGNGNYVFGLIDSAWGGTKIEPWSSQAALDSCGVEPFVDPNNPASSNSYIWNAMIHPFLRHNIYGGLWYQGESNAGWNRDLYNCTFPALISDWRSQWWDGFRPFGFVQLGNFIGNGGVVIRWHQTADKASLPGNEALPDVFYAVAMDTYDEPSGIHPRNKQIIGERLSMTGGLVAYGLEGPLQGPIPVSVVPNSQEFIVEFGFDTDITYNNEETSGFWVCCSELDQCNNAWLWGELPREAVVQSGPTLSVDLKLAELNPDPDLACAADQVRQVAYLWADNPVTVPLGAPVYAVPLPPSIERLPAAPWVWDVNYDNPTPP